MSILFFVYDKNNNVVDTAVLCVHTTAFIVPS